MVNFKVFWRLTRFEHSILTMLGVVVGALLSSQSFAQLQLSEFYLFLMGLGPAFVTAGAFALNDYFGFETDRANKRFDRPIVSGEVKLGEARLIAFALLIFGVFVSIPFGAAAFFISLIFALVCLVYDLFLKKLPFVGNAFVALTMAVPFVYGAVVSVGFLNGLVVVISLIAFLVGIGREILNTTRDVIGDEVIGAVTLPMLIGEKNAIRTASVFILSGVAFSIAPFIWTKSVVYVLIVSIANVLLVWSVVIANRPLHSVENLKKVRNYTLIALAVGLIAFLSLLF